MISHENIDERFTETSSSYNTDYETTQTITFQIKRSSGKKQVNNI